MLSGERPLTSMPVKVYATGSKDTTQLGRGISNGRGSFSLRYRRPSNPEAVIVWVSNFAEQRISQFCGVKTWKCPSGSKTGDPISPDGTGYFDGLVRVTAVEIDPSGNVWATNNWKLIPIQANPGGYEVVVFVGAAEPVRTPRIGQPETRR